MANPTLQTIRPDYTCGFQVSDYATNQELQAALAVTQRGNVFQWIILQTLAIIQSMKPPPDDKPPIEWPLALLILILVCLLVGAFLWMKYATDVP